MIPRSLMSGAPLLSAASFAMALLLAAPCAVAAGPTKDECIESHAKAQRLRRDGKVRDARAALRICVSVSCPALVRNDCTGRLDEIERALPTVVFEAIDGAGKDASAVKVSMDGQPFAEKLDGVAVPVDPGEHTFVFETSGQATVTKVLVLREGDKGRREKVAFPSTAAAVALAAGPSEAPPIAPAATSTDAPAAGSEGRARKVAAVVVGAAGVVGLGIGAVFGLQASASWSSSKDACSVGSCPDRAKALSEHDSAVTSGAVSTVAFIAGGALVATGLVLYLTAPSGKGTTADSGVQALRLTPTGGRAGGGLALSGAF